MYEITTLQTIDHDVMSRDLQIPIDHIRVYFSNYAIYKCFPIRNLTFDEENLVSAIKQVKIMTDHQLKKILEDYEIDLNEISNDPLIIERTMANYKDEEKYAITRKYQHFILEPAVLYGNKEAPLTKPLTMNEVVTLISNIAIGIDKNHEVIDAKTRLSALSKISDIYATSKILENTEETYDPTKYKNLTPDQLDQLIMMIDQPMLKVDANKKKKNDDKKVEDAKPKRKYTPRKKKEEPTE